jgi:hypothetical protein
VYIYTTKSIRCGRIREASAMYPGNTNSWHSPSGYQSYTPTGAVQQAGPSTPEIQTIPGGSRYAEFPWSAEPQNMSMPVPSTSESTPRLSRTSEMDIKSTRGNRLQRASTSTLISAGQPVARPHPSPAGNNMQGGSGYGDFPWASEQIPMSTPVAQPRPPVSRSVSEYTAMLLAMQKIPVGLLSILINALALYLRFVEDTRPTYSTTCMDLVGGLLGASCDFRQLAG